MRFSIVRAIAMVGALLLTACSGESNDLPEDDSENLSRIDSCDLRGLFGTCREYTLTELDEWYREYVRSSCSDNRRGDLVGVYKIGTRCPAENRVARCEGMIEDASERYEYDKHYYANTADLYSWDPENVRITCENVSGNFFAD